jgi:hypothetical protein
VNQTHEDVADMGSIGGLEKHGILSMKNGFLQRSFADVMPTAGLCRVRRFLDVPAFLSVLADAA